MSQTDIIRAWKDEEYFNRLSESERSLLPPNPAGIIELNDQDLRHVDGGTISTPVGCDSFITICSYVAYCTITITITITAEAELYA